MRRAGLLLLLAGCAAVPVPIPAPRGAAPVETILYRDTVTVQFSDGALCAAPRPLGPAVWSGRLSGCPHLWEIAVASPANRARPRQRLGAGAGDIVVLTAPDGTTHLYGASAPSA